MSFTVRKAEIKDAVALGHVQVTSWRSAFRGIASDGYLDNASEEHQTEDWKRILVDNGQIVFVAEVENTLVGFAWSCREKNPDFEWDAEISSIHVLPEYKRLGIGKALMSASAQELRERGCKSAYLWVLEDNHSAIKFYATIGGKPGASRGFDFGGNYVYEMIYGWNKIEELID